MRSIYKYVAMTAASALLVPPLAAAADLEAEFADMKQRMEVMEDQIRAQNDELAEAKATVDQQNEAIEQAGLEEREEVSALSAFIENTDFNAWVATSYNYNFRGASDGAANTFQNQAAAPTVAPLGFYGTGVWYPHHGNSNTFQLDQAWIEIDKAPTEESRAGAHIDIQAGASTGTGGLGAGVVAPPVGIYSAYVSYLAPIWNGIQIDGGIMPTLHGGEVEQTNANFNITRGILWGLQPVTNTGVMASMEVMDGFSFVVGMLNNPIGNQSIDGNRAKALTTQIAYSAEKYSASVGLNWGRNTVGLNGNANQSQGILDVLLTADPLDNLSVWINYDFRFEQNLAAGAAPGTSAFKLNTHGVSVAGRLGILDNSGIALRYEYVSSTDSTPIAFGGYSSVAFGGEPVGRGKLTAHTVTVTADHGLTDNFTIKTELRYDRTNPGVFKQKSGGATGGTSAVNPFLKSSQVVALAQLLYEF